MEENNDEQIRKEFAKAFDWYDADSNYGYGSLTKKLRSPSWEQIFVEIGRLLANQTFETINSRLLDLERLAYPKVQLHGESKI